MDPLPPPPGRAASAEEGPQRSPHDGPGSRPGSRLGSRVHRAITRWWSLIFVLFLGHLALAHYFVLGFVTWDGFGHRVPPVVELVQHGSYGLDKYSNWALVGFRPFIELLNAPFLWAFGQRGLIFAFAVTLFPACVVAIYLFVRELTANKAAGLYAAAVYASIPLVNAQVFSGHVDWAIPGLLAFFMYALLMLRGEEPHSLADYGKVTIGTFAFTMARQQAPYLSAAFFMLVGYSIFVERTRLSFSLKNKTVLKHAAMAYAIGLTPAVAIQALNYSRHGTPIYPYQFELLGMRIGDGVTLRRLFELGGLSEYSLGGFLKATLAAYFIPTRWPACFFDGRHFGDSIFVITALLTLPLTLPRMSRQTRVLLVTLLVFSLVAKDFWQPRYAYGIILAICICNGIAIAALFERRRRVFVVAVAVLALHGLRPEWDAWRIKEGDLYPRLNVAGSPLFLEGDGAQEIFPDLGVAIVIADAPANHFILPLYGRALTNSVVASVQPHLIIGTRCEALHALTDGRANAVVVDDGNLTKDCARTCAIAGSWRCTAFRLLPETAPAAP